MQNTPTRSPHTVVSKGQRDYTKEKTTPEKSTNNELHKIGLESGKIKHDYQLFCIHVFLFHITRPYIFYMCEQMVIHAGIVLVCCLKLEINSQICYLRQQ
jgi:hypothetical protein